MADLTITPKTGSILNIQTVFLGHNNTIDLLVKNNGTVIATSSFTQMTLTFNGVTLTSSNTTASITWNGSGYSTGEVRLHLGGQSTLSTGFYEVPLVTYSASDTIGTVYGNIPIHVKEEVESS